MSKSRAIAAVTQTLAALLERALQVEDSSYKVSRLPLDKSNAIENVPNRLNLFLFQVSPNAAWRNTDLPDRTRPGENGRPPLAINLSYMLTAYGDDEPEGKDHRILGRAMQFLNDHPVLLPSDISTSAPNTGLEEQIERVRITPRTLTLEELVRMWGTFMTQYRISAAYDASVVLIESTVPATAANPVARRGEEDAGIFAEAALPPFITQVLPPEFLRRAGQVTHQPAVRIGEKLTIEGERFGQSNILLEVRSVAWEPRWVGIDGLGPGARPGTLQAVLADPPGEPDAPAGATTALAWNPGVYSAALRVRRTGAPDVVSNRVPFALAPKATLAPGTAPAGDIDLTIDCFPPPRAGQHVSLILGGREPLVPSSVTPPAGAGQPAVVKFRAKALTAGEYLVRLRVDGIDSLPYRAVTPAGKPPRLEYDPLQKLVIT